MEEISTRPQSVNAMASYDLIMESGQIDSRLLLYKEI